MAEVRTLHEIHTRATISYSYNFLYAIIKNYNPVFTIEILMTRKTYMLSLTTNSKLRKITTVPKKLFHHKSQGHRPYLPPIRYP
uniref:Uncharacterized protein n=1 Tax=Arundo donax TaxID=35708 RepID=A0A0A8YER9_ARUDO